MIQVRLLGGAVITRGSAVVNGGATQRHRIAMVALLARAPERQLSRDKLMALLWPEADLEAGQNLLRVALHSLRRAFGSEALLSDGPVIRLVVDRLTLDVVEFDAAIQAGNLEHAVGLYRGPFLDGFHLPDAPEFDQWMETQRLVLQQECFSALRTLAEALTRRGAFRQAADVWRRAAALAPFDSQVAVALMRALGSCGDIAGAVVHARTHIKLLQQELGVQPPAYLVQLESDLRDGRFTCAAPAANPGELPVDSSSGSASTGTGDSPTPTSAFAGVSPDETIERVGKLPPFLPAGDQPKAASRHGLPFWAGLGAIVLVAISVPAGTQLRRIVTDSSGLVGNRIVVLPFENETGDSSLAMVGRMAADWITQALNRTGLAQVVPASEVAVAGKRLGRSSTPEARAPARQLAVDMRAGLLVSGRFYRTSSGVTFQAVIVDTKEGTVARTIDAIDDTVRTIEETVDQLRQRTVGALATVLDPRLADWSKSASQPPSFAAYRLYANALDLRESGSGRDHQREVANLLLRAAAADSNFTAPLIWATRVYMDIGEFAKADSLARTLAPRRDHLAPWDRAMYDFYVAKLRGAHLAAYQAMRRVAALAPGSQWMLQYSFAAMTIGRAHEAIEILSSADGRRNITSPGYWNQLLNARHQLGDYSGELADIARMREHIPDGGKDAELAAWSALGRVAPVVAAAESLLASTPNTFQNAFRVRQIANELWAHGHREDSRRLYGQVADWVKRGPEWARGERSARMVAVFAMLRAGREAEAQPLLEALGAEADVSWEIIGYLGIQAARAGNHAAAESRLQWLLRREGEFDTGEPTMWAAAVAAHMGQLERAIEIYQAALTKGYYQHVRPIHTYEILEPLRRYAPFREITRLR